MDEHRRLRKGKFKGKLRVTEIHIFSMTEDPGIFAKPNPYLFQRVRFKRNINFLFKFFLI